MTLFFTRVSTYTSNSEQTLNESQTFSGRDLHFMIFMMVTLSLLNDNNHRDSNNLESSNNVESFTITLNLFHFLYGFQCVTSSSFRPCTWIQKDWDSWSDRESVMVRSGVRHFNRLPNPSNHWTLQRHRHNLPLTHQDVQGSTYFNVLHPSGMRQTQDPP